MKFWLIATLALLTLTACEPADKKAKSVKERLEAGEVVEFTKPGYRRPGCPARAPDYKYLDLKTGGERERVVGGLQTSALEPGGLKSCFRVGSTIELRAMDKKHQVAQARITKLSLVLLEHLPQKAMKGAYFKPSENFGEYKDQIRGKMKIDHEGYVTILDLEYLPGSAADEQAIREKFQREAEGDGFSETSADGSSLSYCDWADIQVPEAFHEDLLNGNLRSFYVMGSKNCHKQGEIKNLRVKGGEVKGRLKVLKVKKFRLSFVAAKYFPPGDFARLEAAIKGEKATEWMTVMELEVTP